MKNKISSVISTVLMLAFVFMAVSMVATLAKGNPEKENKLAIVHEGNFYLDESAPIVISDETALEFEVRQYGELNDVCVAVYAIADEEQDFLFRYAGQTHSWNEDVAGRDVTELLGVTVTQANEKTNAKIVFNDSLVAVLEEVSHGQEVGFSEDLTHSLLRMEVSCGAERVSVKLLQVLYVATSMEISDSNIIF